MRLFSWTGWTREDWIDALVFAGMVCVGMLVICGLLMLLSLIYACLS